MNDEGVCPTIKYSISLLDQTKHNFPIGIIKKMLVCRYCGYILLSCPLVLFRFPLRTSTWLQG